jgi:AraC family transcriptional regulator
MIALARWGIHSQGDGLHIEPINANRLTLTTDAARLVVSRQFERLPRESAPVIAIPSGDVFSIIVQLRDFTSHKLWRDGRLLHAGGHVKQAVAITHLAYEWRCQHLSAFDNVRFLLTRQALDEFTYDNGQQRIDHFNCAPGATDPVIFHLAQALVGLMDRPLESQHFLLEHISLGLYAHITATYGQGPRALPRQTGRLAPWQEKRAKEFMQANLSRGVSLAQIAQECGLSRAHFARYFKHTTGMSAYTWLQNMRINHAQELLVRQQHTLTQIALECGFTDQSHFSKVFKALTGVPPGNWQRQYTTEKSQSE